MTEKSVIIVGSYRKNGNTTRISKKIAEKFGFDTINLNDYQFSYYDYDNNNREDDFLPLMKQIIEKYDTLIFSTPVYWYSMSSLMKLFFDRLTDLIGSHQEIGRQLMGKKVTIITTSNGNNLGENFFLPFIETANYLHLDYQNGTHYINKSS